MCMASDNCKLQERVDAIDQRVKRLEDKTNDGFASVTSAINDLGHDFGERMNTLDRRIVEEKAKENERKHAERVKWGDTLRKWGDWVVRLLCFGCAVAMGLTTYKLIFGVG